MTDVRFDTHETIRPRDIRQVARIVVGQLERRKTNFHGDRLEANMRPEEQVFIYETGTSPLSGLNPATDGRLANKPLMAGGLMKSRMQFDQEEHPSSQLHVMSRIYQV
jgi:hypothetical protein